MQKLSLSLLAAAFISGCATSAQPEPEDFVIADGKSGVLVEAIAPSGWEYGLGVAQQHLILMKYDPASADPITGPKAKINLRETKIKVASVKDGYLFQNLKPGHYMVRGLVQQDFWQTCFQDETIKFEIKPNTIAYLGKWKLMENSLQLQKRAVDAGDTSTSGAARNFYFDEILPPQIIPATQDEINRAKTFISKFSPNSKSPVMKAETTSAKFRTGKNLLGQRTC